MPAASLPRLRWRMQLPPSTPRPLSPPCASDSSSASGEPNRRPWLLVGLGNPGKVYQGTRHNVGFEMIDFIAEAEGISMSSVHSRALFGKDWTHRFNVPLNQVLLIYDDLDLPFAKLRLLPKGGHGGHNGLRSVINYLNGSREFPRLRIGIGRPPGKMDPASFVLRPFNKKEREELDFAFQRGLEAVRILVDEGFN